MGKLFAGRKMQSNRRLGVLLAHLHPEGYHTSPTLRILASSGKQYVSQGRRQHVTLLIFGRV